MAVMRPKKPIAAPPPDPLKHTPEPYKGVTVDSQFTPTSSLTTYLEGQSWSVDYYSQVIDQNDGLSSHDPDLPAVYQQYRLVRGFEFKVTAPLQISQDSETKSMTLTGAANIYSVLIPNEGDMFIADIGDGREGLFSIITSTRLTIYKETAHTVDYKLISYNTKESRADLDRKIIETVYFDREYLRTGNNPLLTQATVDIRGELYAHYSRLIAVYFNDFYSRELNTLLVPDQRHVTYDPFLVRFVFSVLGTEEHPYIRHIQQLNVSQDNLMYELTLWHCLERMDYRMLPMAAGRMGLINTNAFFSRPMYNSVYYTKVRRVIYPLQKSTGVDADYLGERSLTTESLAAGGERFSELNGVDDYVYRTDALGVPHIKPVTIDSHYVLSESFYKDGVANSVLEQLVEAALKGQAIDLVKLNELCQDSLNWPNLERFYYTPLLLVLLKVYPRTL